MVAVWSQDLAFCVCVLVPRAPVNPLTKDRYAIAVREWLDLRMIKGNDAMEPRRIKSTTSLCLIALACASGMQTTTEDDVQCP